MGKLWYVENATALTVAIFTLVLSIYFLLNNKFKKSRNLPPGPLSLPIIGNLHNLGFEPFKTFMRMRKEYGDVFSIKFGSYPAIILNGPTMIRKYLNMPQLLSRPQVILVTGRNPGNPKSTRGLFVDDLNVWTEQRRFVVRNLRDFGFGRKSMEGLIQDEVGVLIETFRETLGKPILTQDIFNKVVVNSLYTICTGERSNSKDEKFEKILQSIRESARAASPSGALVFFPKICHLFPVLSGYKNLVSWSFEMLDILKSKYEQHKLDFQENSKRDLIDSYILEMQNTTNPSSSFYGKVGIEHMLMSLEDLLVAGSETTSTTLSWTFLILAMHPEIQDKLQDEIDRVIGAAKPSLSHRENMPYYQCLIMEILRYSAIVPLSVFRSLTETVEIEGFTIPKDTIVFPNLYGVHRDPEIWGPDVDDIKPERFLSEDGKTPLKSHEALIPFSTGKRNCLGEPLARDSLFLFITSIFQIFRVSPNPNGPKPTLKYHVGFTLSPLYQDFVLHERNLNTSNLYL